VLPIITTCRVRVGGAGCERDARRPSRTYMR
jgi:hypothetical protein